MKEIRGAQLYLIVLNHSHEWTDDLTDMVALNYTNEASSNYPCFQHHFHLFSPIPRVHKRYLVSNISLEASDSLPGVGHQELAHISFSLTYTQQGMYILHLALVYGHCDGRSWSMA